MKECTKCLALKPLIDFVRDASQKSGFGSRCKPCHNECGRQWALRNPGRRKALAAKAGKKARGKDPGKFREYGRKMYAKHRTTRRADARRAYHADPERHREKSRAVRKNDPEYFKNYNRHYRRTHGDLVTGHENARRARKANADGDHTADQWAALKEYFGHCCAYCLRHEAVCGKLTRDHMSPLKYGGSDDIANIVPSCRKCNSSKNSKSLLSFASYQRKLPRAEQLAA